MSDDLISRKAVLEILYDISDRNYGSLFGHGINKACDVIEHVETAFDKEKVIEKLQRNSHNYYPSIDHYCISKKSVILKEAIDIIEKGGIE